MCTAAFGRRAFSSTSLAMAAVATTAVGYEVAIIGGGVAGCSAARSLALQQGKSSPGSITIYEIGRGPGGRASTRKTRAIPELRINHGAPYADINTTFGRKLVIDLGLPTFDGRRGAIDSLSGLFTPTDDNEKCLYITGDQKHEMACLAQTLLSSAEAAATTINMKYSTMVRGLSYHNQRWSLLDKTGETIGTADWLVVAGSSVAHPRWSKTFGGDPPLVLAAAEDIIKGDSILHQALASIGKQEALPVLAVFFYLEADVAQEWLDLGFHVAEIQNSEKLSKIMIQPNHSTKGCAVVLHSTSSYALDNTGVYGSTSSAARVGDASSDSSREGLLIQELLQSLSVIPGVPKVVKDNCAYGPFLHRWGSAFPLGDPLSEDLAVCPTSRVAFCGDYVETMARTGSVESAMLSGTSVGEKIAKFESDTSMNE